MAAATPNENSKEFIYDFNFNEISKSVKKLAQELQKLNIINTSAKSTGERLKSSINNSATAAAKESASVDKSTKSKKANSKATIDLDTKEAKLGKTVGSLGSAFKNFLGEISPVSLSMLGLSFSLGSMVNSAWEEIRSLSKLGDEMTFLANETGGVNDAIGLLYKTAGDSALGRSEMMGALKNLTDQGISAADSLHDLGVMAGDLQVATGLAATEWSAFTGELSYKYNIPVQGLKNISSGLIATGLRGAQLTKAIGTVNKVLNDTAFISGKSTPASLEKTSKAVAGSISAFNKLGISAETAGGFLQGLTDPEAYEKNAYLLAKMGIGASEYAGYLNDADGQAKLLNKAMSNLPALASEISSIQNPFARMQLAKTIGLPMEIVSKMAGKTKSQIQDMMAEYNAKAKDDEALKKKAEQKKISDAKFDDQIADLKRAALMPLMKFLSGNMGRILGLLGKIVNTVADVMTAAMPVLDRLTKDFIAVSDSITSFIKTYLPPFIQGIMSVFGPIYNFFAKLLKTIFAIFPSAKIGPDGKPDGSTGKSAGKLVAGGLAAFAAFKAVKGIKNLFSGASGKTVSNAKVGELAKEIAKEIAKELKKGRKPKIGKKSISDIPFLGKKLDALKNKIPGMNKLKGLMGKISLKGIGGKLLNPLSKMPTIGAMGTAAKTGLMAAPGKIAGLANTAKTGLMAAPGKIASVANTAKTGVLTSGSNAMTKLGSMLKGIGPMVMGAFKWIKNLKSMFSFGKIIATLKNIVPMIMRFGKVLFSVGRIFSMLNPYSLALQIAMAGLIILIKDIYENFDYYRIQFEIFVDKLVDVGKTIVNFFVDLAKSIWSGVTSLWNKAKSIGSYLGKAIMSILPSWLIDGISSAVTMLKSGWQKFKDFFNKMIDGFISMFQFGNSEVKAKMTAASGNFAKMTDAIEKGGAWGKSANYTAAVKADGTIDEAKLVSAVRAGMDRQLGETKNKMSSDEYNKYAELLQGRVRDALLRNEERKREAKLQLEATRTGNGTLKEIKEKDDPKPPEIIIEDLAQLTYATLTGSRIFTG